MQARGIKPLTAAEILQQVADERQTWKRLLTSDDDRIVLNAITYLTDKRDGRAPQNINVHNTNVNISASDILRAREIARQMAGAIVSPTLELVGGDDVAQVSAEEDAASIMLPVCEGGKKDGGG